MRPDLPQGVTGDPTTPDDRIVQTYVAYIGTYTLDGKNLAVKVKVCPRFPGFAEEVTVVAVLALFTVCRKLADVGLAMKLV
jgi:hypothetical protein